MRYILCLCALFYAASSPALAASTSWVDPIGHVDKQEREDNLRQLFYTRTLEQQDRTNVLLEALLLQQQEILKLQRQQLEATKAARAANNAD